MAPLNSLVTKEQAYLTTLASQTKDATPDQLYEVRNISVNSYQSEDRHDG